MSDNGTAPRPFIDIERGEDKGNLVFRTFNDAENWVKSECSLWDWLSDDELTDVRPLSQTIALYTPILTKISNLLRTAANASDPDDRVAKDLANAIREYVNGETLNSDDLDARFLTDVQNKQGQIGAAAALAVWHNKPWQSEDMQQFRGAVAMILHLEQVRPETPGIVSTALQEIANNYNQQLTAEMLAAGDRQSDWDEQIQKHDEWSLQIADKFENSLEQANESAAKQCENANDAINHLIQTYNTALALSAPVQYWSNKRGKHRFWTVVFGFSFLAFIAVSGLLLYLISNHPTIGTVKFWADDPSYGIYGLTVIGIALMTGLARILLRLTMSQLHMANDADERVTMVNTYLALRQGGHAENEHIQIVIERLFAPSSELVPPCWTGWQRS